MHEITNICNFILRQFNADLVMLKRSSKRTFLISIFPSILIIITQSEHYDNTYNDFIYNAFANNDNTSNTWPRERSSKYCFFPQDS